MKKAWQAICRFFMPHPALLLILTIGSAAGLFAVFTEGLQEHWSVYGLYSMAAYTTVCLSWRMVEGFLWGRKAIHRNSVAHRYLTDLKYKGKVSLWISFLINLLYVALKGLSSVYYHSAWFGALACYYFILAAERFVLLRHLLRRDEDEHKALHRYRFCGYTLLILTPTLLAIGFQAIRDGEAASYPGYLIYVAAGYTFYSFGMAVRNLIRYRRLKDPIHNAAKMLGMATALVSVFFLQTAMFAAFDMGTGLADIMNPITGAAVFLMIMALAVYMIRDGRPKEKTA